MAFNKTSQAALLLQTIGIYGPMAMGMAAASSGGLTVTVPQFTKMHGIVGIVQGATGAGEMVICTDITNNVATLETISEGGSKTGSSVVMWIAWGEARL